MTSCAPAVASSFTAEPAADATIKMFPLFWKHVTILGTSMGSPEDFAAMLGLFADGLRPIVDCSFSLADGAEAFRRLATSAQFGKVVLTV